MILHVFMLQIAYTTIFQWPWNKHYLVSHEPVIAHLFLIWFLMFIDGSDTNNFESWTTKDHFSPKFLRIFFCIICLISIHLLTILTKKQSYSMPCSHSFLFIIKQQQTIKEISILVMAAILNGGCHSFWLIKKQQWTIEEISIFSNSSHLEWWVRQLDTILKGDHPRAIPAKFGLIWYSSFKGGDLNVIFY